MLALRFVLAHPDRVATLILMNTSPAVPEGMARSGLDKAIGLAIERGMSELQILIERAGRQQDDPLVRGWLDRYWAHHRVRYGAMDPQAYAEMGRAMLEQVPVTDRLGEIVQPSLILVGEGDHDFLPGTDRLEAGIPGAHRVTLTGAGHHPHQESPEEWLGAVLHHLREND
jgi:pimeloyl-ACP methyl ester carboxylesterase